MTDADPKIVATVNQVTGERFQLEVEREAENQRFQAAMAALEAEHAAKLQVFTERQRQLDPTIWQIIDDNRTGLIARGKRSFATMVAKFQLKDVPARTSVLDKRAIMEVARQLGVVRQIAKPPKGEWRFDQKKFLAWLAKNGEQRHHFEPFLEELEEDESLTVAPNTNYTVEHDSQRISPPSLTIEKSRPATA